MPTLALPSLARPTDQLRNLTRVALQFCCFSFLLLLPIPLTAQTELATLSGTVTDSTGAVIPKAQVTVTNEETRVTASTQTTGGGVYTVSYLSPGSYRVTVEHEGFKQIEVNGLSLHVQDVISRNFTLPVGASSEVVQVEGNQSAINQSAAVGLTVTKEFIENIPLNGRSLQDLITLMPGAIPVNSNNGDGFSINGQRNDANYYTVDGVAANLNASGSTGLAFNGSVAGTLPSQTALGTTQSLVSVDALQEFRIQTSGFSAEFGRQPGGQIELTTRSGTDIAHGSLFDYFRNEDLDANDWFSNHNGIQRLAERQNDFGGTLGGLLRFGFSGFRSKETFGFFSYEGLRLTTPGFYTALVPSLSLRNAADSQVQPFLKAYPIPNGSDYGDGTAQFTAGYGNLSDFDVISLRLDRTLGKTWHTFFRYSDTPSDSRYRIGSTQATDSSNTSTYTAGVTTQLRKTLINQLRLNYSSAAGPFDLRLGTFGNATPFPRADILPPQYDSAAQGYNSNVFFFLPNTSCCETLSYQHGYNRQNQWNLVDSVDWIVGRHSVKTGVDFRRLSPTVNPGAYASTLTFSTSTGIYGGIADFLGLESFFTVKPSLINLSLFVNDQFKPSPNFTIEYGVRWEFNPHPGPSNGVYPLTLTQVADLMSLELAPEGTPQYQTRYTDFAPRLGLSYTLRSRPRSSTVVKAATGLFYDTGQNLGLSGYGGYPFSNRTTAHSVPLPLSAGDLAAPSLNVPILPPYGNITVNDPHLKLPYTEQWNLSVDQQLGTNNVLTIAYVGNGGHHLLQTLSYASPTLVNPDFPGISIVSNAAYSKYDALQIQVHGRVASGLEVIGGYTWAHATDTVSFDSLPYGVFYGNADNDIRQNANVAVNYQIPSPNSDSAWRWLGSQWRLDSRIFAQSGYPVDIFQTFTVNPITGISSAYRPDLAQGVPLYFHGVNSAPGGWQLNRAAFAPVPTDVNGTPLRQGTLGRNFVHGPNLSQVNVAAQRAFPLHDRLNLELRVEAFNIANHPTFSTIDNFFGDSTFGQATGTPAGSTNGGLNSLYAVGGPRSLQLVLKLRF